MHPPFDAFEAGVAPLAREREGVGFVSSKLNVRGGGRNRVFHSAEWVLGWVRSRFGGFVLRESVARMKLGSKIEDGGSKIEPDGSKMARMSVL